STQTTFTDAGSISLSPLQGPVSTAVTVTTGGNPFNDNQNDIGIYWNGTVGTTNGTLVATCSTNPSNGNVNQPCTFNVPLGSSIGAYTVVATEKSTPSKSESATFTVTGAATQITFGTQPSSNARGTSFPVTVQAKDQN